MSLVFRVVQPYLRCLESHPLITKSITAGVIISAGDLLSQTVEIRNENILHENTYNWFRTAKMFSYGILLLGPILHNWYKLLAILTRNKTSSSTQITKIKNGLKMTILDQTIAGPFCTAMFMAYFTALQGNNIQEKLEKDYVKAMKIYYQIWPFVQFVNFTFVPLHYRVLLVNSVSVIWNAILSHLQHYRKVQANLYDGEYISCAF